MKNIQHIVLIDDNRTTHCLSQHLIKNFDPCIKISPFINGGSALAYFKGLSNSLNRRFCSIPDLVILDINMPDMNGWEVLEEFENMDLFKKYQIDVLMLTSSECAHDLAKSIEYSLCKGYLTKPLSSEKLSTQFTNLRNGVLTG
ncbi:response regulator [Gilvibacter sediminis]|uniref:response regulator n=1 Tax=Gilvibacter sediminis TaxID=379071 RepID=UPI00235000E2|nr:response regulator [Gilvibacter sediminis]MDC7997246.1 response regulator [Gilvibacter sediminis]